MQIRLLLGVSAVALGIGALAWAGPQSQGKIAPWEAMKATTEKLRGGKAIEATDREEKAEAPAHCMKK